MFEISKTQATVANCIKVHQRLVSLGVREMPNYAMSYEEVVESADCAAHLNEIRQASRDVVGLPRDPPGVQTEADLCGTPGMVIPYFGAAPLDNARRAAASYGETMWPTD